MQVTASSVTSRLLSLPLLGCERLCGRLVQRPYFFRDYYPSKATGNCFDEPHKVIGVMHQEMKEFRGGLAKTSITSPNVGNAQIHEAAALLKKRFPFQTFDILYGMSGQDDEELISDLAQAVGLGTTNVDIYPIDNIVAQVGLHAKLAEAAATPTFAMRKFSMNLFVDQFMRRKIRAVDTGNAIRTSPCSPRRWRRRARWNADAPRSRGYRRRHGCCSRRTTSL